MINRRSFLHQSSLVALAPLVPAYLNRAAMAAGSAKNDARILVVIELDGGNDGINTVVPFKDEGYAQHRSELRLATSELLKISNNLALHPSMRSMVKLLDDGKLAIIQGVGYPKPDRSHFRGQAIWRSARMDVIQEADYGWAGLALDTREPGSLDAVHVGPEQISSAIVGRRSVSTALHPDDSRLVLTKPTIGLGSFSDAQTSDQADDVDRLVFSAFATASQVAKSVAKPSNSAPYPDSDIARRLQAIARLIKSDSSAVIYYAMQSGYDTHAVQIPTHARLLTELSEGVSAFLDDLESSGLADRVLLLTTSEFGRRVSENGSFGTDHGTAAPLLLAGSGFKAGVHGETPSLTDLVDGDLKHSVDFRQLYATILEGWLGLDSRESLGGTFSKLPIFG